jgi:hypothetical protein
LFGQHINLFDTITAQPQIITHWTLIDDVCSVVHSNSIKRCYNFGGSPEPLIRILIALYSSHHSTLYKGYLIRLSQGGLGWVATVNLCLTLLKSCVKYLVSLQVLHLTGSCPRVKCQR